MTPIDIRPADLEAVRLILRELVPAVEVRAFGSRVAWNARETSDLDLALMTERPLTLACMAALRAAFTDADLPFRVDIVDWASTPEAFRRVVEAEHVVLNLDAPLSMSRWVHLTVADACEAIDYGLTAAASDQRSGPRFLRITDIVSGQIDWNSVPHVAADDGTSERYKLHDDDIVLARTGASTGASAYIKDPPRAVFASYLVRLRAKPTFSGRYLAYYLKSEEFSEYIRGVLGDKSAQPNASATTMTAAPLYAPRDKNEQSAIAHILGTLDDRIELNRRMNATLEAMARALFRSWFVDFDPVRAKMEGRDTGLPKEIADLFPDRLVDSTLGDVPEGWDIGPLAEHFEAVKGVSYKGSGLGLDGTPLHNLNSIHEGGGYKYEGIKFYAGDHAERHVVRPGDVIVANTEQGHERLLIGFAAIVPNLYGGRGIYSHHVYRLRPRDTGRLSAAFLQLLLNSPRMHDLVSGYANGTTVNMLPMDAMQKPLVLVPPRALIEAFDGLAVEIEHRREHSVRESRALGVIRDALLPKLVSGELRVTGLEPASAYDDRSAPAARHEA
ncbi:MAG: restriction endonuclease subunit S [Gammaproteobacteria bacterium]|nr:restriction endonuclease subunit S [Gammaproteobacteria bacterium]